MDRRDFLVGAGALALGACGGVRYVRPTARDGRLLVSAADLEPDGQLFVQAAGMQRPIFVSRGADGGLSAVLASCTHNGCQPEPVAGRLACPCHGSEFTLDGRVLQGPAERPLTRYRVTEDAGEVAVWLDREPTP